ISKRRARSAPATRLDTGKFASVANRTAYTSYLSASARRPRAAGPIRSAKATAAMNVRAEYTKSRKDLTRSPLVAQRATQHFADQRLGQLGPEYDVRRHFIWRELRSAECSELTLGDGRAGPNHNPRLHRLAF